MSGSHEREQTVCLHELLRSACGPPAPGVPGAASEVRALPLAHGATAPGGSTEQEQSAHSHRPSLFPPT
eukprot:8577046-Pyramimonas_sp.AAC.1